MNSIFERYDWQPHTCASPSEVQTLLEQAHIPGKKIRRIRAVGMAHNLRLRSLHSSAKEILMGAGLPCDDLFTDAGKAMRDQLLLRREVNLTEPVIIEFEDGHTLEMQPDEDHHLLVSFDQLKDCSCDGINHSNFDSEAFFAPFAGLAFDEVMLIRRKETTIYPNPEWMDELETVAWEFTIAGRCDYSLRLRHKGHGYTLSIPDRITLTDLLNTLNDTFQIPITDGPGDLFRIMPARLVSPSPLHLNGIQGVFGHMISGDCSKFFTFLSSFLDRHFDSVLNRQCEPDYIEETGFDLFGSNLYTYDSVERMLEDIERSADLLETDFDHESIAELVSRFCSSESHFTDLMTDEMYRMTKAEKREFIRCRIGVATDFYRRFTRRMRMMMQAEPDQSLICFEGP